MKGLTTLPTLAKLKPNPNWARLVDYWIGGLVGGRD